jgi:hypothetical protein
VLSVIFIWGAAVVTDLLLYFLGLLLHLGLGWVEGSALGINEWTLRAGAAAAGEGSRYNG